MPYTLKQAAEATGKSKPTILRALQKGTISGTRDHNNEWQIEPAELHRVYDPVTPVTVRTDANETEWNDTQHPNSAFEMGVLSGEIEQLRERLTTMQADREQERRAHSDMIDDLRRRLDAADQERREAQTRVAALLTDQREKAEKAVEPPPPVPAGFWQKLFKKAG
jgi:FtsZ-binding cell division protein ZapB